MRRVLIHVALCWSVAACDVRPDASTYDRSCAVDDDCVAVHRQASCDDLCGCPDDAININEVSRFADEQELVCIGPQPEVFCAVCGVEAVCADGTCNVQPAG